MELACLDLEGVLIPEIWIGFAEKTGIEELRATTRDIPDYDELMQQRLGLSFEEAYMLMAAVVDVQICQCCEPGAFPVTTRAVISKEVMP